MNELVEKLNAVTIDQVQDAARSLLEPGAMSLGVVGPRGTLGDYDQLAAQFRV